MLLLCVCCSCWMFNIHKLFCEDLFLKLQAAFFHSPLCGFSLSEQIFVDPKPGKRDRSSFSDRANTMKNYSPCNITFTPLSLSWREMLGMLKCYMRMWISNQRWLRRYTPNIMQSRWIWGISAFSTLFSFPARRCKDMNCKEKFDYPSIFGCSKHSEYFISPYWEMSSIFGYIYLQLDSCFTKNGKRKWQK